MKQMNAIFFISHKSDDENSINSDLKDSQNVNC